MLTELWQGLVHLFYPRLCEGCSAPLLRGEQALCVMCALEIPRTAFHDIPDNEATLRLAGRVPFAYATALAWFVPGGLLQHLLHGLKYRGRHHIGNYLGTQLGCDLKETEWIAQVDALVPVPLHRKKEHARGYNQSALIADGAAGVLHLPVLHHVLIRVKHTASQTRKSRVERLENMDAAFSITNEKLLEGKHVLLIDDVLTTGATIEACAQTLLKGKGVTVSIATIGLAALE